MTEPLASLSSEDLLREMLAYATETRLQLAADQPVMFEEVQQRIAQFCQAIEALPMGELARYGEPLGLVMEHFAALRSGLAEKQQAITATISGLNRGQRASRAYAHAPEV